jgi:hypothetical protein
MLPASASRWPGAAHARAAPHRAGGAPRGDVTAPRAHRPACALDRRRRARSAPRSPHPSPRAGCRCRTVRRLELLGQRPDLPQHGVWFPRQDAITPRAALLWAMTRRSPIAAAAVLARSSIGGAKLDVRSGARSDVRNQPSGPPILAERAITGPHVYAWPSVHFRRGHAMTGLPHAIHWRSIEHDGCGEDDFEQLARTRDSPNPFRFRPPLRPTFRFRVPPPGVASSYSRSVLGAAKLYRSSPPPRRAATERRAKRQSISSVGGFPRADAAFWRRLVPPFGIATHFCQCACEVGLG